MKYSSASCGMICWAIGLLWLLSGFLAVQGQDRRLPDDKKYGFFLSKNKKVVRVPFELYSNLILVPVRINDSDTLRFILDTGVTNTIVTDPSVLDASALRIMRRVSLSGLGEESAVEAGVAIENRLVMGGMRANFHTMVVLDQNALPLSDYVGVTVHGIFGYEVFSHFVVTIDFQHKELILTHPKHYRYRAGKGERHSLVIRDHKPMIETVTVVREGVRYPLRMVLDTGAGHALILNQRVEGAVPPPSKVLGTQLGRGINGVVRGDLGRVPKLHLGSFVLEDVLAAFPDSTAFDAKLPRQDGRQGSIGCELLRRFVVTLHYPEQYLLLRPIQKRLREPFEYNMSGLQIRTFGKELRTYYIDSVRPDTPASGAGLRAGDQIMFVDGEPVETKSFSELTKVFQKGDGKEVELLIKRDGNLFFSRFVLRRMI